MSEMGGVSECASWTRLVDVVRSLVLAQLAPDDAAVRTAQAALDERRTALRALVGAGLGVDGDHPALTRQAALLARDVHTAATRCGVMLRAWLSSTRTVRDAASATVTGGLWWDTPVAVPGDVRDHWSSVLSLGAGARARRTGVALTGPGELIFVGEPDAATCMVLATAWLLVLLEGGHVCAASFTASDAAWLSKLCDEMRT